jgi:hypothetical protein
MTMAMERLARGSRTRGRIGRRDREAATTKEAAISGASTFERGLARAPVVSSPQAPLRGIEPLRCRGSADWLTFAFMYAQLAERRSTTHPRSALSYAATARPEYYKRGNRNEPFGRRVPTTRGSMFLSMVDSCEPHRLDTRRIARSR